jgi:hypothetical protein
MQFLKDVAPMSAPLGAHLDTTVLEKINQTQQWFKIGRTPAYAARWLL